MPDAPGLFSGSRIFEVQVLGGIPVSLISALQEGLLESERFPYSRPVRRGRSTPDLI